MLIAFKSHLRVSDTDLCSVLTAASYFADVQELQARSARRYHRKIGAASNEDTPTRPTRHLEGGNGSASRGGGGAKNSGSEKGRKDRGKENRSEPQSEEEDLPVAPSGRGFFDDILDLVSAPLGRTCGAQMVGPAWGSVTFRCGMSDALEMMYVDLFVPSVPLCMM